MSIRDGVVVSPGIIGSNSEISAGVQSQLNGDIISGGSIFLANCASVDGSVYYLNQIDKQEPLGKRMECKNKSN